MSDVEQIEHFTGFGLYDKSFIRVLRELNDPTPFLRGIVAELGSARKMLSTRKRNVAQERRITIFTRFTTPLCFRLRVTPKWV